MTETLPLPLQKVIQELACPTPMQVHALKLRLARLAHPHMPPFALNHLLLAEQYLKDQGSAHALSEARQECWAHLGSLACYCSISDSAAVHAVSACLESNNEQHTVASLVEQVRRVLDCDVSVELVLSTLTTHDSVPR